MNPEATIRAWKSRAYRNSLSEEERQQLPEHPSGLVELDDHTLNTAMGGDDLPNRTICYTEWNEFTLGSCCAEPSGGGPPPSVVASPSQPGGCPSGAGTSFCTCP